MPSFGREFDATKDQKNLRGSRNNFRVLRFNGNLPGWERYSIALGIVCITGKCLPETNDWLKNIYTHLSQISFIFYSMSLTATQRQIKLPNYSINENIVKKLRWCAWDLNPGPPKMNDGRHTRIHIFRLQTMTAFDPFMLHKWYLEGIFDSE